MTHSLNETDVNISDISEEQGEALNVFCTAACTVSEESI